MTEKHTHCYSNYVNHILNNSPSKTTFSFSKGQRFEHFKKQVDAPVDFVLGNIYSQFNKKNHHSRSKDNHERNQTIINNFVKPKQQTILRYLPSSSSKKGLKCSRSKGSILELSPFEKYLNNEIIRKSSKHKNSRSKSYKVVRFQNSQRIPASFNFQNSPSKKKKIWDKGESSERKRLYTQIQPQTKRKENFLPQQPDLTHHALQQELSKRNHFLKYSPYYKHYLPKNQPPQFFRERSKEWNEMSKQKHQKELNRTKTFSSILQEINHPSKNITAQGYYPVGLQINPDGKYVSSPYKNVPVHTFGKSPKKSSIELNSQYSKKRGKDRSLIFNEKQSYPESRLYAKNFTQKKTGKETRRTEQSYVPFSQFGIVSPFKY